MKDVFRDASNPDKLLETFGPLGEVKMVARYLELGCVPQEEGPLFEMSGGLGGVGDLGDDLGHGELALHDKPGVRVESSGTRFELAVGARVILKKMVVERARVHYKSLTFTVLWQSCRGTEVGARRLTSKVTLTY